MTFRAAQDGGLLVDAEDEREVEGAGAVGEGLFELAVDAMVQSLPAGPISTAVFWVISRWGLAPAPTSAAVQNARAQGSV